MIDYLDASDRIRLMHERRLFRVLRFIRIKIKRWLKNEQYK